MFFSLLYIDKRWMTVWTWLSLRKHREQPWCFCQSSRTEDLHLPRHPARSRSEKSLKISRLLTYLWFQVRKLTHRWKLQALWPDDSTNPAKNMKSDLSPPNIWSYLWAYCIYRFGYQFNPDLHIMDGLSAIWRSYPVGLKASSVINR